MLLPWLGRLAIFLPRGVEKLTISNSDIAEQKRSGGERDFHLPSPPQVTSGSQKATDISSPCIADVRITPPP